MLTSKIIYKFPTRTVKPTPLILSSLHLQSQFKHTCTVYYKLSLYHNNILQPTENKHVVDSNQQFLHTWRPAILFTVIVHAA